MPERSLWARARKRAEKKGIAFNVSSEWLTVPPYCPVLGIPLMVGGPRGAHSPSLDRVSTRRGYVLGNIRVISDKANRLKSDLSLSDLERRAAQGDPERSHEFALLAAYVDREMFLAEIWAKAARGGRAGEEWAKIASALHRIYSRQDQKSRERLD